MIQIESKLNIGDTCIINEGQIDNVNAIPKEGIVTNIYANIWNDSGVQKQDIQFVVMVDGKSITKKYTEVYATKSEWNTMVEGFATQVKNSVNALNVPE